MGNIITAVKLWQDGVFSRGSCPVPITCDRISGNSPRPVWLVPAGGCCGDVTTIYDMTLQAPPVTMVGVLQGVYVETGGTATVFDVTSAQTVIDACNECCNTVATSPLATRYGGVFPSISDLVSSTYTFTRTDGGTQYDTQRAALDYLGKAINGTFNRTTYSGGVSTYTFGAYFEPIFLGGDTKTGETSKLFDSNTPPSLSLGEELTADIVVDGVLITPELTGATVAALVTAATASSAYNVYGTYSSVGGKLRLTTTVVNQATVTVGKHVA